MINLTFRSTFAMMNKETVARVAILVKSDPSTTRDNKPNE